MAKLPTKVEIDARYTEFFAETFQRNPGELDQFFSELENVGKCSCSGLGREAIVLASWRYKQRMKARGKFDDFERAKFQLEKIYKKTLQGANLQVTAKEVKRFEAMTNWDRSSPVWDAFLAELERENLNFTFRLWDLMPTAGDARTRFAKACRALHANFNDRFRIGRGSRAKEVIRVRARKEWVMQIMRTFAQEGGSLTIRNRADKKDGHAVDLIGYLYSELPSCCRHTDIGTVARHDIAPIAQLLRKQTIDIKR